MINNGRGVHWSGSVYHSQEFNNGDEWRQWKAELAGLNIKYVKVLDDGGGSSEGLVTALIEECDIIPIVRLYRHEPNAIGVGGQITDREVQTAKRMVDRNGQIAFETNNEPDVFEEWKNGVKPVNWWEIVVDNVYQDALRIQDIGGLWLFPAFTHGGTLQVPGAGYHNVLATFADRNPNGAEVLAKSGVAIHNYMKHPMNYPYDDVNQKGTPLTREEYERLGPGPSGPLWAWDGQPMELINQWRMEDKNPGDTVFQDWTGFNAYQVWDSWAVGVTGKHLPIYTTEGGSVISDRVDRRYPRVSPKQQTEETLAIAQWMMDEAPEWYVAHCDWLISDAEMGHADGDHFTTWETQCWYTWVWSETPTWNFKGQIPCVQAVKDMPSYERLNGGGTPPVALPTPPIDPPTPPVLLPTPDGGWVIKSQRRVPVEEWGFRQASIYGQVLLGGEPLEDKVVTCWWDGMTDDQFVMEDITDSNGVYEFSLTIGQYYVQVGDGEIAGRLNTHLTEEEEKATGLRTGHVGFEVDFEWRDAVEPPIEHLIIPLVIEMLPGVWAGDWREVIRGEHPWPGDFELREWPSAPDLVGLAFHWYSKEDGIDPTVLDIAQVFYDKGDPGVGYHYQVTQAGVIRWLVSPERIAWGIAGYNDLYLHVLAEPDIDGRLTEAQVIACRKLWEAIETGLGLELQLVGHSEVAATECPGPLWEENKTRIMESEPPTNDWQDKYIEEVEKNVDLQMKMGRVEPLVDEMGALVVQMKSVLES